VVRVVDGKKMAVVFKPQCVESMYTHNKMMYRRWEVHHVTGGGAAYPFCFDEPSNRWVVQGRTRQVKCRRHESGASYITITLT
jgi:hypothetical protein